MNYHLNRDGQNLGIFPLEDLQRRLDSGELTGRELVWTEGMTEWQPLAAVLGRPVPATLAAAPARQSQPKSNKTLFITLAIVGVVLLLGMLAIMVIAYQHVSKNVTSVNEPVPPSASAVTSEPEAAASNFAESTPMAAATKPIAFDTNSVTEADAMKIAREFRVRQFIEGYKTHGDRNPKIDAVALKLLDDWIAANYDGNSNTNQAALAAISDQLANDPACTDPLLLTVTSVNAVELHEADRRLERAVKGFENSKHSGYPKFYASVMLSDKLVHDREDRRPVLDAQSLQDLKDAMTDGSIRPDDQAQIADVLITKWANGFFIRNQRALFSMVQGRGDAFQWLALVLQGEYEINEAWRERGSGYANTVSDAGSAGFEKHLGIARDCLTRA
jgi:Na+-transporting methylmalonyl-CoA/oxaloacetate decarboxylase gamma subunit